MVCLGPRKKEKKISSPDAAALKKTAKLKPSKTNTSLAPSVTAAAASIKTKRSSLESTATTKKTTSLSKLPSRHSLLSNERTTPSPVHRSTSPHKPPSSSRPNSILSVKSNYTTLSGRQQPSRNTSVASKRHPISEMKEEVKDLKAKNEENLKLIADQKQELERLKQQLEQQSPIDLKDKEEQLVQREKEIEELRLRLTEQTSPVIDALAQKEKILEEKEAQLQEQKRIMDEKVPEIEKVAKQLELLKLENLDAVNQLASKEKELQELRSMITENPKEQQQESKQAALLKIEELNHQLEAQKKSHQEILSLHEKALAEKDNLLKEQQTALDALEANHQDQLLKLKTAQSMSINELKLKHQQDTLDLEKQLEEARGELEKNPGVNEQLERILHEFEQAEHTHAVQIKHLQQSHQSELSHLENNQKAQLTQLKQTQDLTRDKWTSRYLPTEAVSWPLPQNAFPTLRPTTTLVESKSKTLKRVLGAPQELLTPLDTKKVQIYYSSTSPSPVVKRNQEHIQQLLKNKDIQFSLIDVASSEEARQYAKKCNNNGRSYGKIKEFPQLFVGGEYRGQYEDVVNAIDDGLLDTLMHAAPPVLRPTRSTKKQVRTLKDYDEDEELLKALEQEMKSGKVNLDEL